MFDWLGLSAEATRVLGWVFVGIAIVLIIFLIFFAVQIVRDMKRTQAKLEKFDKTTEEKQKNIEIKNQEKNNKEVKTIKKDEQKITQQEVEKQKEQEKQIETAILKNEEKSNNQIIEQIEKEQENINNHIKSLNLLNDEQKDFYAEIKNLYFSFSEIENNLISDAETFSYNKKVVGLITVKKSIPVLYQKLSNTELTEKFSTDEENYNKYKKIPIQYILENSQIKNAINSIEKLANELQLTKSKFYKSKKFKNLIEF